MVTNAGTWKRGKAANQRVGFTFIRFIFMCCGRHWNSGDGTMADHISQLVFFFFFCFFFSFLFFSFFSFSFFFLSFCCNLREEWQLEWTLKSEQSKSERREEKRVLPFSTCTP